MDSFTMSEASYKNGYQNGYEKGLKEHKVTAYWTEGNSCSYCGQKLEAPPVNGKTLFYHTPYCSFCGAFMKEKKDDLK